MAISTQEQITRELARLRIWRHIANPDEVQSENDAAHDRINALLDQLDTQHSQKV